ncbi:MAG: preprotein translocase subunit SecE [Chthoniobacterales bacterium]
MEVRSELQKASWPWDPNEKGFKRYKELTDSTIVVIITMLLLGGYVSFFNAVLVYIVSHLTHP